MLKNKIQHIINSGYIVLKEDLSVRETGGHIQILFKIPGKQEKNTLQTYISKISKKNQEILYNCLNEAKTDKQVINCTLENDHKSYQITITPINEKLILSFSYKKEHITKDHQYWHNLHSQTITISFNKKLQHIFISGSAENLSGTENEQMLNKTIDEIDYPAEFKDKLKEILTRIFDKKTLQHDVFELHPQKGMRINARFYPELDTEEKINMVHVSFYDLNKSHQDDNLEKDLLNSDERNTLALEASTLGVWEWIVPSNTIYLSRKWKSQLGYYPDELADEFSTFKNLIHTGDHDRVMREIQNFLTDDSLIFESVFRMRHKNGHYVWISSRASCIRDKKNKALRIVGINHNVSNEKKTSNELEIFKQAMVQSPVPTIITDTGGYIEFFNTSFQKKSGWNPDEIIGKKTNFLKSGYQTDEFYTKLWRTITNGNIWQGEMKNKRKNGRYYTEFVTITPIRNKQGTITHFARISQDITLRKKLENELRTARRSAEIANIYKHNLLANMSHKIRTPINGIIGFSDLLKTASPDQEQQSRYIDIIQENSNTLLHLIDYIVDVTRIEANELKIKKESCSLKDMFIELRVQTQTLAEKKGKGNISINYVTPRETHHDIIFTDPIRLKQILTILFENALKQTEKGFIEIGYQIYSERKLQFYVQDSGVGIDETQTEILSNQFKAREKNLIQTKGGMGLGLTICRGLIHLLGGQIGVKSKQGKGSIFYFMIPYDKIKVPTKKSIIEKSKKSKYDFGKYKILIAEDVAYNFEYLKNIFTSTGAEVIWAKDGIDVLNIFNNEKIDLILMDIQLPEISGLEATRQIRKKNKLIPIIAQTGYTLNEDHEKCLSIGCNDILIKPLKIEDVLKTVSRYLK